MMLKSIFKKLLVTNLLIIISVIGTISLILSIYSGNRILAQKQNELDLAAQRVNHLIEGYYTNAISKDDLQLSINSIGYVTDSSVYAVKMDKQSLNGKQLDELTDSYIMGDLSVILEGNSVFRKNQYSGKFGTYVVFVGTPIIVQSRIIGAVLLFSPVDDINNNIADINRIIWFTAAFVVIISAAIIYLNALRISRPIKKMEAAARSLAAGEATFDLEISSGDEIGRLAKTFNYMKNQLILTEKVRREFITNVSHELRTPLTSIRGFVQGMLDGLVKSENYDKYLNIIMDETLRLTRLTNDILEIAKLQSGTVKLIRERVKAVSVINEVTESLAVLLEQKSIKLEVQCPEEIEVYADIDRLKQILINLAGNSIKYTNSGGAIYLSVVHEKGNVLFKVRDTGVGISEDELPYIFDKFYKAGKGETKTQFSTGIGLNIVKNLVELHGGKIWADSRLGEGTEIKFTIC